jgi:hypothetical protein
VTFTKLFSSITASTIWCEDDQTRIVWITMLAMANKNGFVFASVPGLAKMAVVPVEATRSALEKFMQPDRDSRSQEHEGRRIEVVDGGWRLLTYMKHRAIRDEEERKEYLKLYMREYRKQKPLTNVNNVNHGKPKLTQAEAEAEADSRSKSQKHLRPSVDEVIAYCRERNSPIDGEHFWNYYEARNWKSIKKWKSAIVTWEKNQKGGSNGTNWESKGERLDRKNKEIAEQCRRELADDDSKSLF